MSQVRHSPRVIGAHNSALLDALSDTYATCLRLAEMGLEIERVQVGGRCGPLIEIADAGPRLRHLRGKCRVRRADRVRYAGERGGCASECEMVT